MEAPRGRGLFSAVAAETKHRERALEAREKREAADRRKKEQEDRAVGSGLPLGRRPPPSREPLRRSVSAPAVRDKPSPPSHSPGQELRGYAKLEQVLSPPHPSRPPEDQALAAALSERAAAQRQRQQIVERLRESAEPRPASAASVRSLSSVGRGGSEGQKMHTIVERTVAQSRKCRDDNRRLQEECEALKRAVVQLKADKAELVEEVRVSREAAGGRSGRPSDSSLREQNRLLMAEVHELRKKAAQAATLTETVKRLSLENSIAVDQISRLRLSLAAGQLVTAVSSPPHEPFATGSPSRPPRRPPRSPGQKVRRANSQSPGRRSPPLRRSKEEEPLQPSSPPSPEDDRALARLHRALAPPETAEAMCSKVEGMVSLLRQSFEAEGHQLPLKRVGGCVYQLGNRKLRLAVHAGVLVVRSGGGYEDLVRHLGRVLATRQAARARIDR